MGPEEKLPHRMLHMDERERRRRLEWVTFVETLPDYFKYEFYKLVDDKEVI